MKNYKFIISGKVQGVYYRVNIQKNAINSGYNGYVKNLSDGRVEACVTCDESNIDNFIEILKRGSQSSKVTKIIQEECSEHFSNSFTIR
jgi:acylphosphatase